MAGNDKLNEKKLTISYQDCKKAKFYIRTSSDSSLMSMMREAHKIAKATTKFVNVWVDVKGKGHHHFCTVQPCGEIIEASRGKDSVFEDGTLEIDIKVGPDDE